MTEEELLKEFDFNCIEIDRLCNEAHAAFLKYSTIQMKLDKITSEQTILFRRMFKEPKK